MNSHKNAPLTPKGREAMVRSVTEGGLSQAVAARPLTLGRLIASIRYAHTLACVETPAGSEAVKAPRRGIRVR